MPACLSPAVFPHLISDNQRTLTVQYSTLILTRQESRALARDAVVLDTRHGTPSFHCYRGKGFHVVDVVVTCQCLELSSWRLLANVRPTCPKLIRGVETEDTEVLVRIFDGSFDMEVGFGMEIVIGYVLTVAPA